jgi:two-component system, OmpR family, sensor kinase
MSGTDTWAEHMDTEPPAPPWRHRDQRRLRFLRKLSDRTSLRTKLITALLALVILALAAISVASVVVLNTYLTTQRDNQLQGGLNSVLNGRLGQVTLGQAYGGVGDGMIAGIVQPGHQLTSPPALGNGFPGMGSSRSQSLPSLPASASWPGSTTPVFATVPSQSGGDTWRVIAQTIQVNVSGGGTQNDTLVAALDLGPINAEIHRLILVELIVGGAIVVVLAAVGIAAVQANLRPLNDIEMTASQIAKGHLNHRVPERDPRTEIGSLGHSLNAMLSQIETAFHAQEESEQAAHRSEERMRRFIADASHELRTPLTTIRGFAEYYRQRGGVRKAQDQDQASGTSSAGSPAPDGSAESGMTPQDLDRIMHRLEAEASRMGLLVEDLLTLARLDQQRPLNLAPVDLLTLAADAVQDARMVAPDRPVDLNVAPGAAFLVDGDEARLRQVIGNLVNNALTHTPPGTPVRVKIASGMLEHGTPAVVLDVEDDGPGMERDQAQRVFERFYRADQARNRASGGTGLGLAIVAGLVAAHGGTVSVRTAPGAGADFQVKLPLSPDARAAEPDGADDEDSPAGAR